MIAWSRGAGKYDASPVNRQAADFGGFEAAVLGDRSQAKGQAYVCAPMRTNGDGKPHRGKDFAEDCAWIALDFDRVADPEAFSMACLFLARWRGLGYTTASHTPDAPRARAILEASRPISREERIRCGARIEALVGEALGPGRVALDKSVYRSEQPVYTPLRGAHTFRWPDSRTCCRRYGGGPRSGRPTSSTSPGVSTTACAARATCS